MSAEVNPLILDSFYGPNEILPAVQALMESEDAQAAVVRGLFNAAREVYPNRKSGTRVASFYKAVPDLQKVDLYAQKYWEDHGYTDRELFPSLVSTVYRRPNQVFLAHIDAKRTAMPERDNVESVVSMSLGLGRQEEAQAVWYVERSGDPFYGEDRVWDMESFFDWKDGLGQDYNSTIVREGQSFRQFVGDLVIISQIPRATIHRVDSIFGRESTVFEYISRMKVAEAAEVSV